VIREQFGVDYHERSVSRLLHDLGFSHVSARPQHPKQNAQMIDRFKKISRRRSRRQSRICPAARP
jgi:transposase